MKKIIALVFCLVITASAALAQRGINNQQWRPVRDITAYERFQLRRDVIRLHLTRRMAEKDGYVTPMEEKRIHKMKRKARRDALRYRMNNKRRRI